MKISTLNKIISYPTNKFITLQSNFNCRFSSAQNIFKLQKNVKKEKYKNYEQDLQKYQNTLITFNPKTNIKLEQEQQKNEKNKNLLISIWNINGIKAILNKGKLQEYLSKEQPDILCVNETKLTLESFYIYKEVITQQIPSEYIQYWNISEGNIQGHSGTAIYSKIPPIKAYKDIGTEDPKEEEGRVITLEFENFIVVCCYHHSIWNEEQDQKWNRWNEKFKNHLETLKKENHAKAIFICGDFNGIDSDLDLYYQNSVLKKVLEIFKDKIVEFQNYYKNEGWVDTFRHYYPEKRQYSYWSYRGKGREKNQGARYDYIFANNEGIKLSQDCLIRDDIHGSDHCPVEVKISINIKDL